MLHILITKPSEYSPPQRLEGNESAVLVDISGCVAAVAHRNFYSEVEHSSDLCFRFDRH